METPNRNVAYLFPLEKNPFLQSEYLLSGETVTIGRHPNNIISIQQDAVSRHHAKIENREGVFVISDLNSSNGTFVNGRKISSHDLAEGDILTMGDVEFGFSFFALSERNKKEEESETTVSVIPEVEDADGPFTKIITTVPSDSTPLPLAEAFIPGKEDAGKKSNLRLATLYRLSDLLRDARDRQTILDRVMNLIFEVLPSDRGVILTYNETDQRFDPIIVKYRDDEPISTSNISISRTIVQRCAREKIAILSRDAKTDERFEGSESILMHDIRSAMCVPLIAKSRVLGVLHVDTRESIRAFNEEDLTFISSLANELALSLDNFEMRERMIQQEKMAAIGKTITDVAHNIKNILQLTRGGSQLMDKSLKEGNMDYPLPCWQIIRKGEDKISRFIRDMLDFSRASSGPRIFCSLNAIITEIQQSIEPDLQKKEIALVLDLDESIPDRRFSEDGIYKCLMNLIMNASEAIRGEGKITVSTRLEKDDVIIKVSDTGEGIPPDVMSRLFSPFFTTKGSNGTGLGLCTTKKIIEENNGLITVDSTYGKGATFTITFLSEATKIGEA